MIKQSKSFISMLFFMLVISYANISYASNLEITPVDFSVTNQKRQTIVDTFNGEYRLIHSRHMNGVILDWEFYIVDSEGRRYLGEKTIPILDNASGAYIKELDNRGLIVVSSFPKKGNAVYKNYIVNLKGLDDEKIGEVREEILLKSIDLEKYQEIRKAIENDASKNIETIEGKMPELAVDLKGSGSDSKSYTLMLKNICSEEIEIIKVGSDNPIISLDASEHEKKKISPDGEEYNIIFNLGSFTGSGNPPSDATIKIDYKVGDAIFEGAVRVKVGAACPTCTPEKICPPEKECPRCENLDRNLEGLSVKLRNEFDTEMVVGTSQSLEYVIKNNRQDTTSLSISDFASPIYRDLDVAGPEENCGNSLAAGKSCVVKLLVYPTEAGEIKKSLVINGITNDITVSVKEGPAHLLKVVSMGPVQLTYDGQDTKCLEYQLENMSQDKKLKINSNIPNGGSDDDYAFEFKDQSKALVLDPGKKRSVFIGFDPKKFGNGAKSVNRSLKVKYRTCSFWRCNDDEKTIRIPILINKI